MLRATFGTVVLASCLAVGAPAQAEPATGLYLMTRAWTGSLDLDAYYLGQGRITRSPRGSGADLAKAPAQAVGTYTVQGNRMIVRWNDGQVVNGSYSERGSCFGWDGGLFCPARPFARGTRLDGQFTGGSSTRGSVGSGSKTVTVVFSPDGRYQLRGAGSSMVGSASLPLLSQHSGTYELGGTALTLKPTDGKPISSMAFPYSIRTTGPQPEYIYFDGVMLKRT